MINLSKILQKISKEAKRDEDLRGFLKDKYIAFQNLLSENNHALRLMADMEEKLSGEYLFDRHYIDKNVGLISETVLKIIKYLNCLSNNKYPQLTGIYDSIHKEIESLLTHRPEIPKSDLTIPLSALNKEMSSIAGGKIAHIGEIKNRLNLPTPDGFSISAYAYKRFMEHNSFIEKIGERLSALSIDNLERLNEMSGEIQKMVISAELPVDLINAVGRAYSDLQASSQSGIMVSVRSSAIHEDGHFSFAGQYATFLNVPGESILDKYKEVVASLFTPRAIFYYKTKGFSEEDMVMAVGVLTMIDAKAGGVLYTSDPNDPERDAVIINAMCGLGKAVVDGTETPNSCIVSKKTGAILDERLPVQHTMFVCAPGGGISEMDVPDEIKKNPCINHEHIKLLFDYAVSLENHYGRPQDIEWALGGDGRIYILQSRPLRVLGKRDAPKMPLTIPGHNVLIDKGSIACKGIAHGKAFVLKDDEELKDFPEGAVLVARHTSTKFVTVMNKASAIITDVGSPVGHMASLSREYGVPTILDTETATGIIKNGQELTVDAVNCNIYEGRVEELLKYESDKKESFKDTRLFITLERVLKFIVPLNLVDPDSEGFGPERSRTFHDITRFAHEMAMAEIFKTGKGQDIETFEDMMSAVAFAEAGEARRLGSQTSVLKAGIPIDAHLLDIEGGINGDLRKVRPEDISSIPFSAFLRGLTSMRWPEPRPADVKGFLGMVAHTATITEEQLQKMGGKSYAIISRHYMNFSIRLGYHFSMVEAYAGENMNDNYIKFFFKGGGAATDRRLRRVRLIKEILKKMGFKVNVIEDVIDAMLTKYKQSTIEDLLEVMGKLTVYTKQLDMVMYNDAVTDMFIGDFVRDQLKKKAGGEG